MAIKSLLFGTDSIVARFRDAVRTFRGKRPKHSALGQQLISEQQLAYFAPVRPAVGICAEADIKANLLGCDEYRLFQELVKTAEDAPGPFVQFGTLLGDTISSICLWKSATKEAVAVDLDDANPWQLPAAAYRALVAQALKYLLATGQVTHRVTSVRNFFTAHSSPPPALVFINYARSYEEVREIIQWARTVGASTIAGRGYDGGNPGVMRAVDECGGPDRLEGSVWRLNLESVPASPALPQNSLARLEEQNEDVTGGLVSIVMPAYNAREFIEVTLNDVARQLHRDWELIVVEDGSVHDVEAIVKRFAVRHLENRIVYHRKTKNAGVSSARNDAMALCRGEFVAFLDADDRWSPDHLQRKLRMLHQSGCDLVYSRVEMFDSLSDLPMCTWGPTDDELQSFPESMFNRPYLQPSGVVVRASLLADVGKFDETLAYAEDYDYWFRAIHLGKRFCFDERVTSRYRKNHASAATTGRLVLCYDGVARVTCRHLKLPGGNAESRRRTVARHFLAAGTGHLAFRPSPANGCNPETGKQLLAEACRLSIDSRESVRSYWLARFALATGTSNVFRRVFRHRYKRIVG
jgi:hypothetical protein